MSDKAYRPIKQHITINVTGDDDNNIETAVAEAYRSIRNGNREGQASNETGSYKFTVEHLPARGEKD